MGVYHVLQEVTDEISNNLASKIQEVDAETSGVSLDDSFTLYERERVLTFHKKDLPGIGVWMDMAETGAASQRQRNWKTRVGVDYCVTDQDRASAAQQTELVTDAIMRVLDGLVDGSQRLIASGEDEFGTAAITDLDQLVQAQAGDPSRSGPFKAAIRVEYPVIYREQLP